MKSNWQYRLYVAISENFNGRGVFTNEAVPAGSIIEIAPVIVIPRHQVHPIQKTILSNYVYEYDEGSDAVALGYGSLYNHSYTPNSFYQFDLDEQTIEIIALEDIPAHAELTINYNGDPEDRTRLWFSVK